MFTRVTRKIQRSLRDAAQRAALNQISALPFKESLDQIEAALRRQGFGSGASLASSGEASVFSLIETAAPFLLDGGAFKGEYLSAFLAYFPNGRVIAVEPSEAHFALLQDSVYGRTVDLVNCAIGSKPGQATLYKNAAVSEIASLTQRRLDHFDVQMSIEETVAVRTLDDILAKVSFVDLLKLDLEGHELDALNGGRKALKAGKIGLVQFEFGGTQLDTHTTLQDFFYFFADLGYELSIITPRGLQPLGRYREIYEQYSATNYLARPIK